MRICFLSLVLCLLMGASPALAAEGDDVPWFNQAAAEKMVARAVPEYYAHLRQIARTNPARYQRLLHQTMMQVYSRHEQPTLYAAWKNLWSIEVRYAAAVEQWRQASDAQKPALRASLVALSREWEQARLAVMEAKIPIFEGRLDLLEYELADGLRNLDAYAEERVMFSTDQP